LVCGAPRYRDSQMTRYALHLSVEPGTLSEKVDVTKYLQTF